MKTSANRLLAMAPFCTFTYSIVTPHTMRQTIGNQQLSLNSQYPCLLGRN